MNKRVFVDSDYMWPDKEKNLWEMMETETKSYYSIGNYKAYCGGLYLLQDSLLSSI